MFNICPIYFMFIYTYRHTCMHEWLWDVNIKLKNHMALIYTLNSVFNIYILMRYSCEILNKKPVRINEILKQICLTCVLQGDKYYINTGYCNKFFSDGAWG